MVSLLFEIFLCAFLSSADFFQNQFLEKNHSGTLSECQRVWIQIKPDNSSGLIWVQNCLQKYQKMTLVGNSHDCRKQQTFRR